MSSKHDFLKSFQFAASIADVNAFINIPGGECATYSGTNLANDCTTTGANMDTTSGTVATVGYPFELGVNMVIAATSITGFNLVYNQVSNTYSYSQYTLYF